MYDIVSLGEPLFPIAEADISCNDILLPFQPEESYLESSLFCYSLKSEEKTVFAKQSKKEVFTQTRLLHTGSLLLKQEPMRSEIYEAIDIAKSGGAIISYKPCYQARQWDNPKEAVRYLRSLIITADIMCLTEDDLAILPGESNSEKASNALVDQGVKIIIIFGESNVTFLRVGKESRIVSNDFTSIGILKNQNKIYSGFLYRLLSQNKALKEISIDDITDYIRYGISLSTPSK